MSGVNKVILVGWLGQDPQTGKIIINYVNGQIIMEGNDD